ncbi:unnamed protein product, partial [Coregonus sp. 'balchen']
MSPCLSVSSDRTVRMQQLRVAVVGVGAAGLCAARHIMSRPDTFAPPVAYKLTEHVGGTWFYEERTGSYDNGLPIHSSMYRDLRTNLPKEVMMFPDFPFDPQLPSFLPHQEVQIYLREIDARATASHHTTVVEEVSPVTMATEEKGPMTKWEVTSRDNQSDPQSLIPPPRALLRSVSGGAGASGLDISLELGRSNAQVTLSHGKPTLPFPLPYGVFQATPVVEVQEDGSLQFQDGSITQAQVLLLCTGYNFSYPFLELAKLGLEVQEHLIQFALAVLEDSEALPSRAEMEEEAQRELKRKAERGVQLKHMLKMDKDQWGYAQTLAQTGRFSPLLPVTQSLYEEVWRHVHPQNYRQLNDRLISDTQWEQQELQAGECRGEAAWSQRRNI